MGGDGFCGWATALHLSDMGHEILIVDNLSRRDIDNELMVSSLTPIQTMDARIHTWQSISGHSIRFENLDIAENYFGLTQLIGDFKPNTIIHFAEQRAAPYSMKSSKTRQYTVSNNTNATHRILSAILESQLDIHLIHLGTMGVYGYDGAQVKIPEGYLNVTIPINDHEHKQRDILFPTEPASVYHMTKSIDQVFFAFYARQYGVRITDLHQGIVWGTQTDQTLRDERLINRFDYDGDYGTVLNRFLIQSAVGHPLTVHGTGGQTRAFIHIRDTIRCIELAAQNPPQAGNRVQIYNQTTEVFRILYLAQLVSKTFGAEIAFVNNPRNEKPDNPLDAECTGLQQLGLKPTLLKDQLLQEGYETALKYKDRCDLSKIPCYSTWTDKHQPGALKQ